MRHSVLRIALLMGEVTCLALSYSTVWHQITYQAHLPFWIMLGLVTSCAVETLADLERFQSLASDISPRIQTDSSEADKAAREFTVSIAEAFRLSTRKLTISDRNCDLARSTSSFEAQ